MYYSRPVMAVITALSIGTALSAEARDFRAGRVTHVTDGDTLWVKVDGSDQKPLKLRLRDVDAPEICQAGGAESKAWLQAKVLGQRIRFHTVATDTYRRSIADVEIDGDDLGASLVRYGQAWSTGYRHMPGRYSKEESQARTARRGLFADRDAMAPRLFRRSHGSCEGHAIDGVLPRQY
jgi:micrococcal nuclease